MMAVLLVIGYVVMAVAVWSIIYRKASEYDRCPLGMMGGLFWPLPVGVLLGACLVVGVVAGVKYFAEAIN